MRRSSPTGQPPRPRCPSTPFLPKTGNAPVYNLEVREWHAFLVGDAGVLVHNTCFKETDDLMRTLFGRSLQKQPGTKYKIDRLKAR
ncbi:MAG: hypothetical protein KDC54_19100, partial [Lewinella sp.]|nr:hypothetical protein [Lewinella sp.]